MQNFHFTFCALVMFSALSITNGASDCPNGQIAYVKTVGHIFSSEDDDTRTTTGVSLQDCEDLCTTNEDRRGNRYYCKSFNYQAATTTCLLSNYRADRFQEGSLLESGVTRTETDHYEKYCIRGAEPCPGDAASFTRVPQHILSGYAHHPLYVSSLEECLAACLKFRDGSDPCRSAMYFYEDTQCILNKISRFDERDNFVAESFDVTVDYFDSYCIGDWRPWSSWSQCSTTCGHGLKKRTRTCSLARRCSGDDEETQQCYIGGNCAMTSQWSEWGPCSVTCGRGSRTRELKCPRLRSAACRDVSATDLCDAGPCTGRPTFDDGWDTWGQWSLCDVPCGQGNRYRTRSCRRTNCQGSVVDTAQCVGDRVCSAAENRRLALGGSQDWTGWSRCSTDCGKGTQVRSRPCPPRRNCQLSEHVQTRTCYKGAAAWCRSDDDDDTTSTENPFFRRPVSLAGQYDQWESWSPCTVTCGGGLRTRMRSCRLSQCSGEDRETLACNTGRCGSKWGVWSPWTSCVPACGTGTRKRVRLCVSGQCPFVATNSRQQESCETSCGSQWNAWSPWSDCSATCDSGTQQRKRSCPRDETCRGDDKENQPCNSGNSCSSGRQTPKPVRPSVQGGEKIGDKEADERFYDCCVAEGIAKKCAKATCRYDVTLEESIEAIFDDSYGCDLANINKANKCASDGNDNTACCTRSGIDSDCISFCRPPKAGAAVQSEDDLMLCGTFLQPTLKCHRSGLKPK